MKTAQQLAEARARAFFNPVGHPTGGSVFYDRVMGVGSYDGLPVGYEYGVYVSGAYAEGNAHVEYTPIKVKWSDDVLAKAPTSDIVGWRFANGSFIEFGIAPTGGEAPAESFIWCDVCQNHAHFCTCDDEELPETSDLLDSTAKRLTIWVVLIGCMLLALMRCDGTLPLG